MDARAATRPAAPPAPRRVLRVDLGALSGEAAAPRPAPWSPGDPTLARIAAWGGSALGLALLAAEGEAEEVPLVVAVGEAVRRGLPTAARATVLSRGPLAGLLAEGQVGGELGPRLAAVADALVVHGRSPVAGAVLVVEPDGAARLARHPELRGLDPAATGARLVRTLGPCAVLAIGPAGERGVPFASLAACEERPSFVGRGGLGAVLGSMGLKAICVLAEPDAPLATSETRALAARLASSPRLAARSQEGSLELFGSFAARGDLRARNYEEEVPLEAAEELRRAARARATERKGCRGCPTPCGWVFEGEGGARQAARFSATYALGANLGLVRFQDALALLARCDREGVDAKEVGALLALACLAVDRGEIPGPSAWGDLMRLEGWIAELCGAPFHGRTLGPDAARGAATFARALGLEARHAAARGQTVRPERDLAALLGQCVTAGGTDPMRSFPFLSEAGSRARIGALTGLPLPAGIEDPLAPAGKGRLVWWHENLVAGVDATGFCAFSTAGLLADGLADLDELAAWILPATLRDEPGGGSPGRRLLALGASLALLRRVLEERWGAPPDRDRPAWARQALEQGGMLAEYLALRGADEHGSPRSEACALLGGEDLLELGRAALGPELELPAAPLPADGAAPGRLLLRRSAKAEGLPLALALPARVRDVLRAAAALHPELARELLADGEPLAAVWRAGRRLAPDDPVRDGDVLDLVTAIGGG